MSGDVTFEQLTTVIEERGALEDTLDLYQAQGFTTTSWQPGSVEEARMLVIAECWRLLWNGGTIPLAKAVHNDTATGTALKLLSKSHFANDPIDAVATQGNIVLTGSSGSGELVGVGDVIVADDVTGAEFSNITGGTIPGAGSITLSFQAVVPGAAGNVPNGRITTLSTSISGVTVTNATTDGSSWITRAGVDEESTTVLRNRNRTKWATLGPNGPGSAYAYYALSAVDGGGIPVGITKVRVTKPDGLGAFSVYVANDTATATAQQVSDLQAYLDTFKSPSAIPTVVAATEVPINTTADAIVTRGQTVAAKAAIQTAVEAYINSLDVGGQRIDNTVIGYVLTSEIIAAAMGVANVKDFQTPLYSTALSESEVAVPGTTTLNVTES